MSFPFLCPFLPHSKHSHTLFLFSLTSLFIFDSNIHSLFPFFSHSNSRRSLALSSFTCHPLAQYSVHLHLIQFPLSHQKQINNPTFSAMFAKTALVCALFTASAQVALAQAVVQPACFMKVLTYESYFNVAFAVSSN